MSADSGSGCRRINSYDSFDEFYGYKISRLKMIKFSIYSMINKLLDESPNIKVGLVTFEFSVTIYGDCLEEKTIIQEINDENKLKRFGEEYSYLISNPISKSSNFILSKLYSIKSLGFTALEPRNNYFFIPIKNC